jgi:hypothetical protein
MAALNDNALLMEKGTVYVGANSGSTVSLGAVRNVRFSPTQARNRIESDNLGTILNKVRLQGRCEFDWLEPGDMAKVESLFKGIVTLSQTAGTLVEGAEQVVASGAWNYNVFIPFTYQNGAGTQPTINSVTLGTNGAIVANTDYFVTKDPATGKWGITIIDSTTVTTENQSVTIDTDYTPAAAQVLTGGTSRAATNRYLKIIGPAEDGSGKTRTVILEECTVTSDMLFPFLDVENANDVGIMPVTVESNKGTTWTYTDQINV